MFTYLYETIFPVLGDFFGVFGSFATMKLSTLLDWIDYNLAYPASPTSLYIGLFNVFTGQVSGLQPYVLEISGSFLTSPLGRAVALTFSNVFALLDAISFPGLSILEMPLVVSLPLIFAIFGLFMSLIKFVLGVITGLA